MVAGVIVWAPLRLTHSLHKHKALLANKTFKQRFGSAYEEMRTNIEGNGLIKVVGYYYLRRLLLALTVVLLQDVLVIQFFNFVMSSIFNVILIGYIKPYNQQRLNETEMLNEVVTVFIMYHIFCFTDWVPDANVKYELGFSCLLFNFVSLCVNILQIAFFTFLNLYHKARITYIKNQHAKNRKK